MHQRIPPWSTRWVFWVILLLGGCRSSDLAAKFPTPIPTYTPRPTLSIAQPLPSPSAIMATPSPSASTPTESTNTHSAQVAAGERLYATQCARCHEQDGGIGIRLRRGILLAYVTPARLFRYIQARMPYDTDFRLSDEEYWAITAYLLVRSDLIEAEPPLEPLSAEEIRLQR